MDEHIKEKLKAEHKIVLQALEVANTAHGRVVRVSETVEALRLSKKDVRRLKKCYDRELNVVVHKILDQLLSRGIIFSPGLIARYRYYGSESALAPEDRELPTFTSRRQRVLGQVRATVGRLGRAVLIGEILQHIAERNTLDDLTKPEITHAILSLKETGDLRVIPLGRGDERGTNLYLPAELTPGDYTPQQPLTWLQAVAGAFEELWQERVSQAAVDNCLPRPLSTGEVRSRLLTTAIQPKKSQKAINIINAMIQLSRTESARIRKITRHSQKASLWAPVGIPDEQLNLSEAYANDSERIGAAVRRAVERLNRPVNIRDVTDEIRLDESLHPTGASNLYEILSDLSKEMIDFGGRIRRERGLRRIFHVGRINGDAYFYHSADGLEEAQFYVRFSQIESRWLTACPADQLSALEGCSLPSIAFGRALLIKVDADNGFQRLSQLLDSGRGDAETRSETERLFEEVSKVKGEIQDWLNSNSGFAKECPARVLTDVPSMTSRELLSVLLPFYPSARKLNDPNRLVGLLKRVRRIPNPIYSRRFSTDQHKAAEFVFDQTDALLFAATKWGGQECSFQAMLAKSQLGLLRDVRFVFPVLDRESFEDRLTGVACLAFFRSDKGNLILRRLATSDPNPSVRQSALWACGFTGAKGIRDLFSERSRNDPSAIVRDFAAMILEQAVISWWMM
jgi:hypothetical protein